MTLHNFDSAQPFAQGDTESNWDYVVDWPWEDTPEKAAIWYVARPGSGADNGYMGDLQHIRRLIRKGHFNCTLTPLGRKLLYETER